MNIIGTSYDGDLKYFELLNEKYYSLIQLNNYDFSKTFIEHTFFEEHNLMFSDPLHLLKCVRYRYVNDIPKFPFFTSENASIDRNSFLSIGIPHYILDPHKSKKWKIAYQKSYFNLNI